MFQLQCGEVCQQFWQTTFIIFNIQHKCEEQQKWAHHKVIVGWNACKRPTECKKREDRKKNWFRLKFSSWHRQKAITRNLFVYPRRGRKEKANFISHFSRSLILICFKNKSWLSSLTCVKRLENIFIFSTSFLTWKFCIRDEMSWEYLYVIYWTSLFLNIYDFHWVFLKYSHPYLLRVYLA